MPIEDEMKFWRQVYVAVIASGRGDGWAKTSADIALNHYKSKFDAPACAGKGEG